MKERFQFQDAEASVLITPGKTLLVMMDGE
jgi:hypothetical protein